MVRSSNNSNNGLNFLLDLSRHCSNIMQTTNVSHICNLNSLVATLKSIKGSVKLILILDFS